ncbi:hypothetical protein [uncultured Lactobacillus sp.]|uniref:hypothetical protein n=1 Tax=uncultured Lactobacillus sp. TaxID=153152 RepID=UPI002803DC31|nr:hypothetical protein [uncultured Lactobacillus sp.]
MRKYSSNDLKTRKFIRSRKISAILPWLGILGMLFLVFSLIMSGLLLFIVELGFIANFYYFIDSYNWLADRLLFDPKKKMLTHERDRLVRIMMVVFIILGLVTTALLAWLQSQNFLYFVAGLCFISICYFGSRVIENCLVIFHIQLNNWNKFYKIVATGTILLTGLAALLLYFNMFIYYIYFAIIGIIYLITYYVLIEVYRRVGNDLGGHKFFIDLPDNRFANKYQL